MGMFPSDMWLLCWALQAWLAVLVSLWAVLCKNRSKVYNNIFCQYKVWNNFSVECPYSSLTFHIQSIPKLIGDDNKIHFEFFIRAPSPQITNGQPFTPAVPLMWVLKLSTSLKELSQCDFACHSSFVSEWAIWITLHWVYRSQCYRAVPDSVNMVQADHMSNIINELPCWWDSLYPTTLSKLMNKFRAHCAIRHYQKKVALLKYASYE